MNRRPDLAPSPPDAIDLDSASCSLTEAAEAVRAGAGPIELRRDGETIAAVVSMADLAKVRRFDEIWAEGTAAMERFSAAFAEVPLDELEEQVAAAVSRARAELRREAAARTEMAERRSA